MKRWLHADADMFFAAVEIVKNPALKGKPIVVGGINSRHGVVSTASYEARKAGIHSAMPISVARRLLPDAVYLEGDYASYQSYSGNMFSLFHQYSSIVHGLSIDEADMDITSTIHLYGGEEILALRLKTDIATQLGFTVSVGISSTRSVAKIAASQAKPDGLTIVMEGSEKAFLADLPIGVLPGIGKKSEPYFIEKGFSKVRDLYRFSLADLTRQFGKYGVSLWHLINSVEEERETSFNPSISKETTFEEDVTDFNQLLSVLDGMASDLGYRLRREKKEASCLSIKIRFPDFKTITRQTTLNKPIFLDEEIFRTAQILLKRENLKPVRLIGISLTQLSEGGSLFQEDQKERAFSNILDELRDQYGSNCIQRYHDFKEKV